MNPPPIQWLPVFAQAAEYKSFKKAADKLNVSPPAISQQIKALEEYLGIPLFKRNGPRLELTEAGEYYYESVHELIKGYHSSFEEFDRRFNKRSLRLNAPLFIAQEILIPNYTSYKALEPKAELRITTGTEYIDFTSNVADAAIRFGLGNWPSLEARMLCKMKTSPVCSPAFLSELKAPNTPLSELIDGKVLLTTNEDIPEWRYLFPEVRPKEIIVCDSYFSVIKSAEMGLGIALGLFPAINNWVNHQKLTLMSSELFEVDAAYWLVYPKQRAKNQLIESCYDWAKSLFKSLPELDIDAPNT